MKKALGYLLTAAGGALIGGLATKLYFEKKYRMELKDQEGRLWDRYKEKVAEKTEEAVAQANEALKIVKNELQELQQKAADEEKLQKLGVVDAFKMTAKEREIQLARAFVIRPDEYGTQRDFARFNYVFYPEQDEYYNRDYQTPVEEEELRDMLGDVHPEDHFGEFDDEVVYVRNEDLKVDIAIFLAEDPPDEEDE